MTGMEYWIKALDLEKHPEGGYYKEIYKCGEVLPGDSFSVKYEGERNLATSIYFLLPSEDMSRLHRLKSDELWFYHQGSSLTIYVITPEGKLDTVKLGADGEKDQWPQAVIPKGSIFGAVVNDKDSYSLVGCVVAPGFDFRDFELLSRERLLKEYPLYREVILKLT